MLLEDRDVLVRRAPRQAALGDRVDPAEDPVPDLGEADLPQLEVDAHPGRVPGLAARSAGCTNILVGMQPTLRQVPPKTPLSTRAMSRSANRSSGMELPEPEPMMTRSKCCTRPSCQPGQRPGPDDDRAGGRPGCRGGGRAAPWAGEHGLGRPMGAGPARPARLPDHAAALQRLQLPGRGRPGRLRRRGRRRRAGGPALGARRPALAAGRRVRGAAAGAGPPRARRVAPPAVAGDGPARRPEPQERPARHRGRDLHRDRRRAAARRRRGLGGDRPAAGAPAGRARRRRRALRQHQLRDLHRPRLVQPRRARPARLARGAALGVGPADGRAGQRGGPARPLAGGDLAGRRRRVPGPGAHLAAGPRRRPGRWPTWPRWSGRSRTPAASW